MKLRCFIGAIVFLVLAACQHPVGTVCTPSLQQLSAIDTLMQSRPDSALLLLLDTPMDDPYYQLLLSEALYKNDSAQLNRQELMAAVRYFDSVDCPFLSARCHYMNGVGYYETDSVVLACEEYLSALEIMEEHFEEKELVGDKAKFMALTYTRLTDVFSDQYLHEQAIYWGKQSLFYYEKLPSFNWYGSWMLEVIGSHYDMMESLDSASYYYQLAGQFLNDTNSLMYRDIEAHVAFLSYKKGSACKEVVLRRLCRLLIQAESTKEYLARCLTLGGVYYYERSYDSAWNYLYKVFEETESLGSKKQVAELLIDICKANGRDDEILEYASFLVPFANQEENHGEIKTELTELYKEYSQVCLERQHREKISHNMRLVMVVFMVGFLLLLLIVLLFHKTKRKEYKLNSQIEEEKIAHEMKRKALSGRLKKSNEALRETLKRIEEQKTQKECIEYGGGNLSSERYESFLMTPICQLVFGKVKQLHGDKRKVLKTDMDVARYKTFALSTTQLAMLSKTVDEYFPFLYTSLKTQYPSLSQRDWSFCLLYLLQLDMLSICVLLQKKYPTCRRYTLKLEQAFQSKQGLSVFLMEQVCAL